MKTARVLSPLLLLTFSLSAAPAAELPVGWRTDATGIYAHATPPTRWSKEANVVWKRELPGNSYGSPVVVEDRIFVVSDPAELLCFRAADGELLWQKSGTAAAAVGEAQAEKLEAQWDALNRRKRELQQEFDELRKARPDDEDAQKQLRDRVRAVEEELNAFSRDNPVRNKGGAGNTAGTPVSDGKTVYAVFGSGIVAAYRLDGTPRWIRFVQGSTIGFGHASSPVLIGDRLFVHFHDLIALDTKSGEEVWRTELRPQHASPVAARLGETAVLISPSGNVIRARDGKTLLRESALSISEASPVVADGIVYALSGKASAFKLPESAGDEIELTPLWQTNSSRGRRTPSPAVYEGLLYGVTTDGIFEVTDAAGGENVYRRRLDIGENIYSSVTVAGDYVFISSTNGTTLVLQAGREYKEVARNELESSGSNPVFSGKRMYVRGRKHLYCIGE